MNKNIPDSVAYYKCRDRADRYDFFALKFQLVQLVCVRAMWQWYRDRNLWNENIASKDTYQSAVEKKNQVNVISN